MTAEITRAWDLACTLLPMTDDTVATVVTASTPGGLVDFALEEWFVRERCVPPVRSVRYDGAESSSPAPGVIDSLRDADAIIICPANPILSIAPILAVPGIREAVAAHDRVVGISNLIAGTAVRGPADRLLAEAPGERHPCRDHRPLEQERPQLRAEEEFEQEGDDVRNHHDRGDDRDRARWVLVAKRDHEGIEGSRRTRRDAKMSAGQRVDALRRACLFCAAGCP